MSCHCHCKNQSNLHLKFIRVHIIDNRRSINLSSHAVVKSFNDNWSENNLSRNSIVQIIGYYGIIPNKESCVLIITIAGSVVCL